MVFSQSKSPGLRPWLFALLLLLVTIALRAPAIPWPALEEDEATHFTAAVIMAQGGTPYLDIADGKTPLFWYILGTVAKIVGPWNVLGIRAVTCLMMWATTLLLWQLGRIVASDRAGRWGALCLALFSTTASYKILSTNYELYHLPWDLLAWVALAYAIWRAKPAWGLLAGAAIATAFFIKQTAGMTLATQGALIAIGYWRQPHERRTYALTGLAVCAGFFGTCAMFWWWMVQAGIAAEMKFWSWDYAWILTHSSQGALGWQRFLVRTPLWIVATLPVHVWAVRRIWQQRQTPGALDRTTLWLFTWIAFAWFPISLGGRYPMHYFLVNLPPLCLLAGQWLAPKFSLENFCSAGPARARMWRLTSLLGIPLTMWIVNWNVAFANSLAKLPRADHTKLARRIDAETAPTDRIFVWGHNPEFYLYAQRLPATRLLICDFLTGRHSIPSTSMPNLRDYDAMIVPGAWDMVFADFARHPPQLIIDTSPADLHDYRVFPMARYPRLRTYVDANYHLGWTEDGVLFYVRN